MWPPCRRLLRELDALEFCAKADTAPSSPGAYILQILLTEPLSVVIANWTPIRLPAGRYFYCGSANGPGGLKSRLARHMTKGKPLHWHVDQLTERGVVTGAWILPNGRECDLVAMLAQVPMPIPGFGSSDCSHCRSHLLYGGSGRLRQQLREFRNIRRDPPRLIFAEQLSRRAKLVRNWSKSPSHLSEVPLPRHS